MGPLRLRPAAPDDYASFVRFFGELGVPDPVPPQERWAQLMLPTTGFLEQDGAAVAYAYWEPQPPVGYVRHVVVAPEQRGRRLGYTLMAALKQELSMRGCTRWCLNVRTSNESARRLYHGVGMTDRYLSSALRLPWASVTNLPASETVTAMSVSANDDPALEQRFSLLPGTLEIRRRRPDILVVAATSTSGPTEQGLAVFDPNFPGAYPFRAFAPGAARAILEHLAQHRRPEHSDLQLVIEDDAELTALLAQAGARQLFEVVHMAGDIARSVQARS